MTITTTTCLCKRFPFDWRKNESKRGIIIIAWSLDEPLSSFIHTPSNIVTLMYRKDINTVATAT